MQSIFQKSVGLKIFEHQLILTALFQEIQYIVAKLQYIVHCGDFCNNAFLSNMLFLFLSVSLTPTLFIHSRSHVGGKDVSL